MKIKDTASLAQWKDFSEVQERSNFQISRISQKPWPIIIIRIKLVVCLKSFTITEEVEEFLDAAEKTDHHQSQVVGLPKVIQHH
jgi:hypothetical protein